MGRDDGREGAGGGFSEVKRFLNYWMTFGSEIKQMLLLASQPEADVCSCVRAHIGVNALVMTGWAGSQALSCLPPDAAALARWFSFPELELILDG